MNILVVCQYFWPEPFRVPDLCRGLKEMGHEVTVLTGIPNYPEGRFYKGYGVFRPLRETYRGIDIIRIPLVPRMRGKGYQLAANYFSFAVNSLLMSPFLCKGRFDIIFTYQLSPVTMALPAVLLKKLKKSALIHYVLDLWPESLTAGGGSGGLFYWLIGRLVSFIYKRCDLILVSSAGFAQRIISRGADPGCVKYWPQWAESAYVQSGDTEDDEVKIGDDGRKKIGEGGLNKDRGEDKQIFPGDKSGSFIILFAGNIGEAQGFGTLLDAAEILVKKGCSHIRWLILGDGRLRSWVEKEVEKRGLKEVFQLLGRKPVEEMPYYYSQADALLVSLKDNDLLALTLPAKVQSYLASGKPIIASMNGEGARVVTEAGAGLACRAEDAEELSKLILYMSRLPQHDLQEMGRKGKKYFEANYSRDLLLKQLNEYLHKLHIRTV